MGLIFAYTNLMLQKRWQIIFMIWTIHDLYICLPTHNSDHLFSPSSNPGSSSPFNLTYRVNSRLSSKLASACERMETNKLCTFHEYKSKAVKHTRGGNISWKQSLTFVLAYKEQAVKMLLLFLLLFWLLFVLLFFFSFLLFFLMFLFLLFFFLW